MKKLAFLLALVASICTAGTISLGGQTAYTPVITATDNSAWTVCALRAYGIEFIDGYDHGRCLQSAVSYNTLGEANNPTQAGSYANGLLPNPSSSVASMTVNADGTKLTTTTTMAYWNPVAGVIVSDSKLTSVVTMRWAGMEGVQRHDITFRTGSGTKTQAQFEVLTGYMPASFSVFHAYDPAAKVLAPLSDGPGEQALPIIFCQVGGYNCMGVYSAKPLALGGYGRWRFNGSACMTTGGATGCVKWNAVSRVNNPASNSNYAFTVYTLVGSLAAVQNAMSVLNGTP